MASAGGNAVIGRDLVVLGTVRNGGVIEVLGRVLGALVAERVVVLPGGEVVGTLEATSADIQGRVEGRVRVRELISIGATGAVHGDVRYGQLALAPGGDLAAEVRNVPPELGGDFEIVVRQGRSVRLTTADLLATDAEDGAARLVYTVSNPACGHLASSDAPGEAIAAFSQADIAAGRILFVHDGSAPGQAGFDVIVADSAGASSGAPRHVTVVVLPPY